MQIDVEKLPESKEELQEIILSLHNSLHKANESLGEEKRKADSYKQKYDSLIETLRLAKQNQFSPSSEKNVIQSSLFDEAATELSDDVKEQIEEIEVKAHVRKNRPVRRALPKELPRETILHDIPESEKLCDCGAHLVRIGEEITEQLKYIPAQLSVVQHVRPKYACTPCQGNVKIAAIPSLLLPKSIATPELAAYTIIAKYCDHIPLYRQEAIWKRFDIDMPRSSLCGWVLKIAELCAPLIKLLQKEITSNTYVQADETTVQVLDEPERRNTSNSYMWCYRGGTIEKISIVYEYQETRGGYHAQKFLEGFKGYLQSDAYSGYNWALASENIFAVGCIAHARRPFAQLAKLAQKPGLAHEAVKLFSNLYAIEKEARENKLSPEQRYELRQVKAPKVIAALKKWLDYNLPKTSEQGKIGKAIRYCIGHWDQLTNYINDGRVEIDNNFLENAIRPFTLGRKN